jgi:hypothetical protein
MVKVPNWVVIVQSPFKSMPLAITALLEGIRNASPPHLGWAG